MGSQRLQQKCISVTLQTAAETDALSQSQSLMRFGTKTGPRPRTEISFPERELCDINVCHAFHNPPYTPFYFSSVFIRDDLGPPVPGLVTGGQVAPDCVTPEFTDLDRGLRKCGESQGEQSRATKRPRDREERERGG